MTEKIGLNTEILKRINELIQALNMVDDSHNDDFMFLITPDEVDESDIESWEGSIKRMNRLSKAHMEDIKESLDNKITSLSDYIENI